MRIPKPKRVWPPWSFENSKSAFNRAQIIEVQIFQLHDGRWQFLGGPGRIDIITATPERLTWADLWGSAAIAKESERTYDNE